MRNFLTYLLLSTSFYIYSQCDINLLGGTYKHVKLVDTLDVDVYISYDTLDRTIMVFDYYNKPDTVFYRYEDKYDRYIVDYELYNTRTYIIKKVLCCKNCDNTFLVRLKKNKDRVKWVYVDNEDVIVKHKHSLFKKHYINYNK